METRVSLVAAKLEPLAEKMEIESPEDVLRWASQTFASDFALACSFGAEDMVLVNMLAKIQPGAKVFYLDTGLLFPETYELRDWVKAHYPVEMIQVLPGVTVEEQAEEWGEELWKRDPDRCCSIRKIAPLKKILSNLTAWVTGVRRQQSPTRANTKVIEWDRKFSLIKLNPLAKWTDKEVWRYLDKNQVRYNPLHDQGYPSIGCVPCTRQVKPGEDPRSGRWSGFNKSECGLHGGE